MEWFIISVTINTILITIIILNNVKKDKKVSELRLSIRGAKSKCQELMGEHYGINGTYDRGGLKHFHTPFKKWCDTNHIDCKAQKSMQMYLSPTSPSEEKYRDVNLLYNIVKYFNENHKTNIQLEIRQ